MCKSWVTRPGSKAFLAKAPGSPVLTTYEPPSRTRSTPIPLCQKPQPPYALNPKPETLNPKPMVVSQIRRIPIYTPKCYSPRYWNPQEDAPNFGNPHTPISLNRLQNAIVLIIGTKRTCPKFWESLNPTN